jgi:hypothetical protein
MIRCAALLVALLAALPAPARSQSLFNAAGLGMPSSPLDARTRALGGVGIGLRGPLLVGSDPAAAADFVLPSSALTAQPEWVDFQRSDNAESGTFQGTRFPTLGIAYPTVYALVVTLGLDSFLDQRYESTSASTISFGSDAVDVEDHFISKGGVSQVRFGLARRFGPHLAVGVTGARYGGSITRRVERSFVGGVDTAAVSDYQDGGFWRYSGAAVTGGASLGMGSVGQLSASVTWSSGLDATASEDTEGASRSYDLPLQVRLGASALVAPGLSLSAGLEHADWSSVDSHLADGASAGSTTSYGVGVELTRARLLGRTAPLRVGYRRTELPFALGGGMPSETVWAGGFGLNLSQTGDVVRAGVDLALERGDRSDSVLSERFWRATLTVHVAGF